MNKIKSCPFCKSENVKIKADKLSFYVYCSDCGSWGLPKREKTEAIIAWNNRDMEEKNERKIKNIF